MRVAVASRSTLECCRSPLLILSLPRPCLATVRRVGQKWRRTVLPATSIPSQLSRRVRVTPRRGVRTPEGGEVSILLFADTKMTKFEEDAYNFVYGPRGNKGPSQSVFWRDWGYRAQWKSGIPLSKRVLAQKRINLYYERLKRERDLARGDRGNSTRLYRFPNQTLKEIAYLIMTGNTMSDYHAN